MNSFACSALAAKASTCPDTRRASCDRLWCKLKKANEGSECRDQSHAANTAPHTSETSPSSTFNTDVSNRLFLILYANSIPLIVTPAFLNGLNPFTRASTNPATISVRPTQSKESTLTCAIT